MMNEEHGKKGIAICIAAGILAVLLCACAEPGPAQGAALPPLREALTNEEEVVAAIREGLRDYSSRITVTFGYASNVLDEVQRLAAGWVEEALEETDDPTEGDYMRYQFDGYETTCRYDETGGYYLYTVEITPRYYLYRTQEEEVAARLAGVYAELELNELASDYEKVRAIYDYVCANVRYDKVHAKNPYYHQKSTAYAALIQRTATCQGYCVLLYRMLREAGIDCRIVTGAGSGAHGGDELHAWNIVALGGRYYNLDATWDSGLEEYAYFLRGSASFLDHTPGEAFTTEAFMTRYPVAEKDYFFADNG